MTTKRFINEDGCWGYYTEIIDEQKELDLSLPNPKKNLTIGELVELLNQFQEENKKLKQVNEMLQMDFAMTERNLIEENEQLRSRLKDWHQRTFKAHEYFNILEKVIDEVCDDSISNQIWKEYEKMEKLME